MRRVRQLLRALGAVISPEDEACIDKWLNPAERALFNEMSVPDRKHCLRVASTALELARGRDDINRRRLLRAALLHDVGRGGGEVGTIHKVIFVLAKAVFGSAMRPWGRSEKDGITANLRNALYISLNHPAIGAERLRSAGTEADVILLVRNHHQPEVSCDLPELTLLKKADEAN